MYNCKNPPPGRKSGREIFAYENVYLKYKMLVKEK